MPKRRRIVRRRTWETAAQFEERRRHKGRDNRLKAWLADSCPIPDWAMPPAKRQGK